MPLLVLAVSLVLLFSGWRAKKIIILNGSVCRPSVGAAPLTTLLAETLAHKRTQLKRGPRRRLSVNAANVSVSSLRSDSRVFVCLLVLVCLAE